MISHSQSWGGKSPVQESTFLNKLCDKVRRRSRDNQICVSVSALIQFRNSWATQLLSAMDGQQTIAIHLLVPPPALYSLPAYYKHTSQDEPN